MKPGTGRKPMTWKRIAVRTATCGWFLAEQRNILFSHTISDGPVVERMFWIFLKAMKEMILDSSKTKEAINYCLNRWENLENFIKYPGATFSTNTAERSVKSWVMARRNFLFSGSGNGARASCFILSLIETVKQNGIAPEDYLRCLFEKAPYAETREDWEKLLLE